VERVSDHQPECVSVSSCGYAGVRMREGHVERGGAWPTPPLSSAPPLGPSALWPIPRPGTSRLLKTSEQGQD
jgi:hypothetical protein